MEDTPLVISKQKTEMVCGVPTQVVCTAFSSHILVVVTQFGKMGTLVSLEPSSVANDISKPVLTTKVLLGQDEPLIHVFAKNLVAFVSQEAGNKAVLLAVAMKDKSMEGVKALREVIRVCQQMCIPKYFTILLNNGEIPQWHSMSSVSCSSQGRKTCWVTTQMDVIPVHCLDPRRGPVHAVTLLLLP
ncbi:Proteasome assembly chaperone 3 [Saguinus oedipus]|uniref:Proteasome assembly chaperone 3 n=1 Tax=Saguinus oedipus TaxID=9490 RepID=A0ABQ9W4I3_SAGOE|nr:Proteasome assembly chaperone 3 [Saguinus oedipus]